jgi:hypothetical protein
MHCPAFHSFYLILVPRVSFTFVLPQYIVHCLSLHTQPSTAFCHTAYELDEGNIVDLYRRIMTQNLQETMPLGIQRSRSRLGELLAADTLVAAGSATLITPAVMIFDR